MDRLKNYKTLAHPEIDEKEDLKKSLIVQFIKITLLVKMEKTSGIVVYLKKDERLAEYIKIKEKFYNQSLGESQDAEKDNYKKFLIEYEEYKNLFNLRNHQNITEIRDVINKYGESAKIHLGGVPMIADDMMSFIKSDIVVFGLGVFVFIIFTLWFVFRNIKWVIMPLLGCSTSVLIMIGLLGLIGWKVTVISSNFIALMLILNMAMNIHVTVRFLQLKKEFSQLSKSEAVLETSKKCFCNTLHSANNYLCFFIFNIQRNKTNNRFWLDDDDGIDSFNYRNFFFIAIFINFIFFDDDINVKDIGKSIITFSLGYFAKKSTIILVSTTILLFIISIIGISKLEVENSFINYFDQETEIYKGMKKIDDDLGGTTPFECYHKISSSKKKDNGDDEFSEWDEDNDAENNKAKYWFTRDKMDKILKVHDYLDSLPEIGKVLSFGSILRVAEDLNKKELQSLEIAVLYSKIPEEIKRRLYHLIYQLKKMKPE